MPPVLHPGAQKLGRIRYVVPHGDPCHCPESRGSEDQRPAAPGHDRVVRELILNHDIGDHRRTDHARWLLAPPAHDVRERSQSANLQLQRFQLIARQS